eukprot:TRINITY_DN105687_c0_g1_i1.p3 TRINITY_DN105687_c0_g1~~TRINITY_DN105687_c0_g1_i1.p3  ORF type:complete len:148 (-),score=34.37 TRINITY_DN105687_c0_g1_i1:66-443(-)
MSLLGRFAASTRRLAAPTAALARAGAPAAVPAARNFAQVVRSPRPLSIRMDGLMAQCIVAAVIYFVPQDLIFLGGLFWCWHTTATSTAPKQTQADAEAALEEFKSKKGLSDVKVSKGRSTWYVTV